MKNSKRKRKTKKLLLISSIATGLAVLVGGIIGTALYASRKSSKACKNNVDDLDSYVEEADVTEESAVETKKDEVKTEEPKKEQ